MTDFSRRIEVEEGAWRPPEHDGVATVVIDGLLSARSTMRGMPTMHLFGSGDVIADYPDSVLRLSTRAEWTALTRAAVVLVDAAPSAHVSEQLQRRAHEQIGRALELATIAHLPRVEDRILGLFGHLCERHGRVARDGIVIDVALTHVRIGEIIGARRPTVSLALRHLADRDLATRRLDGRYVITALGQSTLDPAAEPTRTVSPRAVAGRRAQAG